MTGPVIWDEVPLFTSRLSTRTQLHLAREAAIRRRMATGATLDEATADVDHELVDGIAAAMRSLRPAVDALIRQFEAAGRAVADAAAVFFALPDEPHAVPASSPMAAAIAAKRCRNTGPAARPLDPRRGRR